MSREVKTFEELRELMLLEAMRESLPDDIRMHLDDVDATLVYDAGRRANMYALSHRRVDRSRGVNDRTRMNTNQHGQHSGGRDSSYGKPKENQMPKPALKTWNNENCEYYKRPGHTVARCFAKQWDDKAQTTPMCLVTRATLSNTRPVDKKTTTHIPVPDPTVMSNCR